MYYYNKSNTALARNMRKEMTPWERKLWLKFLRTLPQRINRQKQIGNYIADFYCPSAKLVIELDGAQHYEDVNMIKDRERTKYFESLGIKVVRYTNYDIDTHFENVCEDIYNKLNNVIEKCKIE